MATPPVNRFGAEVGEIEDVVEPITAYRWFKIAAKWDVAAVGWIATPRLASIHRSYEWPTAAEGGAEAVCDAVGITVAGHTSGRPPCPGSQKRHNFGAGCGIYGLRDLFSALVDSWGGDVLAEVELGGRFITHENGWRAQYAAVTALYDLGRPLHPVHSRHATILMGDVDLDALAARYGVPLRTLPDGVLEAVEAEKRRRMDEAAARIQAKGPYPFGANIVAGLAYIQNNLAKPVKFTDITGV